MDHQPSKDTLDSRRATTSLIRNAARRGDRTCLEFEAFETELKLSHPGLSFLMGAGRDFADEDEDDDMRDW